MFYVTTITQENKHRFTGGASERFAGNIGYSFEGKYVEYTIHSLDDYDKCWTNIYKLKAGEQFFRLRSRVSDISSKWGFIAKVNIERGLVYFLSEYGKENDCLDFETKGIKLKYLNLLQS